MTPELRFFDGGYCRQLLALVDRPARVLVLQQDRLVLDARVETGADPTGCLL